MKTIELTRGKTAIVDDDDYEFLLQWRWIAMPSPGGMWYAARHEGRKVIFMHRVLLGLSADDETDHKNRDGLDNRRQNLRRATRTQNQQNRGPQLGGTSRYKGVHQNAGEKSWRAQIHVNKQKITRSFPDEESAARFYDEMARRHFGEFAVLNFA